ncbi:ABC transporter ATP-binding protein [Novosphingobium barchaimii LL02]|uniref:ABC transporter ATP-binding protein n=1 Tax=Novosphingobium barchaimii LL02 TaxID=1114963 RepID=A0A0J8AFA8_9SPHN|nr:ABC transporter ATP-binding protein [Novosphingobium barchaimii]KMS53570.1 ABC transporter ATP-binding protein [Novosphingobium barchaimii LL02]
MTTLDNVVSLDRRARRAEPADPILSVNGLRIIAADGRELVRDMHFNLPRGGTLGIVGESGSGKSLTCRAILDVLPPGLSVASGSIRYRDVDLSRLDATSWRALRGVELSAVFQDPGSYLNPSIPVGRQLAEAIRANLKMQRKAARDRALDLLGRVGFADATAVYHQYPYELSGGMAQRVLIALAICAGPSLLIADEATTALDVTVQAEILALIDTLRREEGLTLILVSHDLAVVSQVCDHVIVMRSGEIVEAGSTREILHHPKSAYTRSLIDDHAVHPIAVNRPQSADAPQRVPILSVRGLHAGYGIRTVVQDIDLQVAPGEILGLIGETGSGKTTLLRTVLGLIPAATGAIELDGQRIDGLTGKPLRDLRRSGALQYVFQDPLRSLDPDLTIGASIAEGLYLREGRLGVSAIDASVTAALRAVGLEPELSTRLPRLLSGGQRQRAVIARALALEPKVLLLDEPVSALDAVNRLHVLKLLRRLADERGIAQIFISHDLGSVAGIADRVAVLYRGQVVETGPAGALLANPSHPYTRKLLDSAPRLAVAAPATRSLFTVY